MNAWPPNIDQHRVTATNQHSVLLGKVRYSPIKSLWLSGMAGGSLIGGLNHFTWQAFLLFAISTAFVLLFGHSLGSHRKLIHNSYQCPKWLEYMCWCIAACRWA